MSGAQPNYRQSFMVRLRQSAGASIETIRQNAMNAFRTLFIASGSQKAITVQKRPRDGSEDCNHNTEENIDMNMNVSNENFNDPKVSYKRRR